MGRELGGGFMFGNACTPVVDSCQCMAKLAFKKSQISYLRLHPKKLQKKEQINIKPI